MDALFPESYEASRSRFIRDFELVRTKWANTRLESYPLKSDPSLTIDYAWAEPRKHENLVIVSTGQHGIEGYVGSVMLKVFMDEFAPLIDQENTGLLLIHAINPWGMKNNRKVTKNGVDLNRNFITNGMFDKSINPDFSKLKNLLAPAYPIRSFGIENLLFAGRIIKALITKGAASLTNAALLGQYITPQAIYYGGERHEEQTVLMTNFFRESLEKYQTIIHLDLHSGYGPRYQMSITLVPLEPLTSAELSAKFNYPLVLRGDRKEFYETLGDMTAYLYELRNADFQDKHVFASVLEFGTYGESLLARIHSLRTMIFESQVHWHGVLDKSTEEKICREFKELYFPTEEKWCEKAMADCRQAYAGILSAYGVLGQTRDASL
jgi:hypothetical protein